MSRPRFTFPRVAPRTRPRPPRVARLPTAKVGIYDNGVLVSVKEFPDQRVEWCKGFNAEWASVGMTAEPIVVDEIGGAQ